MTEEFKTWAMVELFGHTRIAGEVTEQTIAGGAMVRIDVPESKGQPAFTRIVNVSAIYAINPVTEEVARELASKFHAKPVDIWDIREYVEKQTKLIGQHKDVADDIHDDDDDEDETPF